MLSLLNFARIVLVMQFFATLNQHTVSRGAFECVVNELFVKVLCVIDSPIDGRPCDELECCGPLVVLAVFLPTFEHQKRLIAIKT